VRLEDIAAALQLLCEDPQCDHTGDCDEEVIQALREVLT
jgi:hypothetical protein